MAPELEFFLVQINTDPDLPLLPPVGRSGRTETGRQAYGIDAINEFDPIFEDVYDYCEAQEIDIDTLTHEAGAAQIEINFNHGDALTLADQVFLFKRTVRQVAMRQRSTPPSWPSRWRIEPGSAMHIHQIGRRYRHRTQPVRRRDGGTAHCSAPYRRPADNTCPGHAAVRAQREFLPAHAPAIGRADQRPVGRGQPVLRPARAGLGRTRPADREPAAGADANPYLAIAASLACGYLGMIERMKPTKQVTGNAYRMPHTLPRTLYDALHRFGNCKKMRPILGERFMRALMLVKQSELEAYQGVISSWEREHLLLKV